MIKRHVDSPILLLPLSLIPRDVGMEATSLDVHEAPFSLLVFVLDAASACLPLKLDEGELSMSIFILLFRDSEEDTAARLREEERMDETQPLMRREPDPDACGETSELEVTPRKLFGGLVP